MSKFPKNRKQTVVLLRSCLLYRGGGEQILHRQARPDTNFIIKCSIVIDEVDKLIHKHPKYSVNQH